MIYFLKNEYLEVEFSTKGAELQCIRSVDTDISYMWDGDSTFWGKFSPVLFPIVGALKDNSYYHEGIRYNLPRHGFARDLDFDCVSIDARAIDFKLSYNADTLKVYPFKFELTIQYRLVGTSLSCTYQVFNAGKNEMLFSIGAHPAFAAPLNQIGVYTDYHLLFNNDQELTYHHIVGNLIANETSTIILDNHALPLTHELFYDDALVFKNLKSTEIKLLNTKNDHGLSFQFEGFPYFGIWAAKDANFVCLEPWCGIADSVGHKQQFAEKEGMEKIDSGILWQRTWKVSAF